MGGRRQEVVITGDTAMKARTSQGFTLTEIMIVVAVIGLLASIAAPSFVHARRMGQGVRVANDLRVFGQGFAMYAMDHGLYPPDNHEALPSAPGLDKYINEAKFNAETAFGGRYNWEGPDSYPYAGVSVSSTPILEEHLTAIDAAVDDGDLSTGNYIVPGNGRFTYIIERR